MEPFFISKEAAHVQVIVIFILCLLSSVFQHGSADKGSISRSREKGKREARVGGVSIEYFLSEEGR